MGRGAGPAGEGDDVRLLLLLVCLIGGCTHVSVQGGSTTSSGVSVGYAASGSAAVWALIGIGLIAAHQHASGAAREGGFEPGAPPPPLAPGRSVNEVDCTKPIEDWSGNLKCK
jgi:hypothetical protein